MNMHQNARLTPLGRERLVALIEGGMAFSQAGQLCVCTAKTAAKWHWRFQREGWKSLADRYSRPHVLRAPTPE